MILEFMNANGHLFKTPYDRIGFVLKEPLEPIMMLALDGVALPIINGGDFPAFSDLETKLTALGFKTFASHPKGGTVLINFQHMLFYSSPELGAYGLVFKGQAGVGVKATEKDILAHFEPITSILQS